MNGEKELYYDACFPLGRPIICKTCYYDLACAEYGKTNIIPIAEKPLPCETVKKQKEKFIN